MGTSLGQPTAGSTTGRSTAANFCFDELYGTGNGGGGGGDRCVVVVAGGGWAGWGTRARTRGWGPVSPVSMARGY